MSLQSKYLSILLLELDGLEEDITLLIDDYRNRQEKGEITNYVLLENLALLKSEIHGIDSFRRLLNSLDPDSYNDLDALVQEIRSRIKEIMDGSNFPESLYPLVLRRLAKVARFVKQV